jgi:alanyl-tRNA synthetase
MRYIVAKTAAQIRTDFIEFFKSKEHDFVRSAPVAPQDDPTLMFTNAGMNQFKAIFLGENPQGLKRAVNSQKCMRVSGKHNDLEEVGVDHHHHTLFEMLGNWSFGDYYKKEAITWAWELITDVWGLDKSKLYATVFESDDEAEQIWNELTDVPKEHITRHGAKDNFWEMGETGPCGPCSEIHYDTGEGTCIHEDEPDHTCEVNGDECGRYVEIWNLVFMQNNRLKDGSLEALPAKHVDTGMGFERIVRIIQKGRSNYDSDLFMPIIVELEKMSGEKYGFGKEGIPFRVIADHIRALVIAITDGVFPSNEGRGYVLRRLLRRAYRYGRTLGFREPFMNGLVPVVVKMLGDAFPEIKEREDYVTEVIKGEEQRFDATLEHGLEKFNQLVDQTKKDGSETLTGHSVFLLNDTYGFPMDLTRLMADEIGLSVDEEGFEKEMNAQRERARAARSAGNDGGLSADGWTDLDSGAGTTFLGYDKTDADVTVNRYKFINDKEALVVLGSTPFYAEMGGEVGDSGTLSAGDTTATVYDTINWNGMSIHKLRFDAKPNDDFFKSTLFASVDENRQNRIRRNHSATHLLQAALEEVLGDHVSQSGSRCDDRSLRFDFTHFSAVTKEELNRVEDLANSWIRQNCSVSTVEMGVDEAREAGAKALFGEKYGDSVRVVTMGDESKELCGGLHASATGEIGSLFITSEASVSSGVRRIEAITGEEAVKLFRSNRDLLAQVSSQLNTSYPELNQRIVDMKSKVKELEKELKMYSSAASGAKSEELIERAITNKVNGLSLLCENLGSTDKDSFSGISDSVSDVIKTKNISDIVIVLIGEVDGKVMLSACADKGAVKMGVKCGDIVKAAAKIVQGGGGGSPVRAQAGGKDASKIPEAIVVAEEFIAGIVG